MIDLHSHILPGIDDGSKSVEMSLEMLRKSAAQGVKTIFATPHFYATRHTPQRFFEKRQNAWEQLQPMLEEGMPKVILGAEVTYFEGMSRSQELENMRLGDSNLLLVEMPTTPWTDYMMEELECIPRFLGLQPVLAHIDRYMHRSQLPRFLDDLLELEVLLQANANAFGSVLQRGKMLKLVQKGLLDFIGSDTHNLESRGPNLEIATQAITKKLGAAALEDLNAHSAQLLNL